MTNEEFKKEALAYILEALTRKWGGEERELDDTGCYAENENGEAEWFSPAEVARVIERALEEI